MTGAMVMTMIPRCQYNDDDDYNDNYHHDDDSDDYKGVGN